MHLSIFRNIFEIFQTSKIDLCTESVNYISKNPLRGVSPASILSLQASPCLDREYKFLQQNLG